MNTPQTQPPASLASAHGSAFFRPRNGDELIRAIADGKTCEVPNGWGMKALAFLESRLSNWSVFFDGSTNKGWSILKPTGDTPERFRRYLQIDKLSDRL